MFAKVHPAEDVKSGNTGSCHDLVRYLEKETGEGQRFFSHTEQDISPERVIMDIDGNKKALGANDAKFFMLSLNPSQSEQMHLIGRYLRTYISFPLFSLITEFPVKTFLYPDFPALM